MPLPSNSSPSTPFILKNKIASDLNLLQSRDDFKGEEVWVTHVLKLTGQYKNTKDEEHRHKTKEIQNTQELCSLVFESNLPLLKDSEEIISPGFLIYISTAYFFRYI